MQEVSPQYSTPQEIGLVLRSFAEAADTMKRCSKCGEIKSLNEFYLRKGHGGIRPWCKECCKKVVLVEQDERREAGNCTLCNKPSFGKALCPMCAKKNMVRGIERVKQQKKKAVELLGGKCRDCGLKTEYLGIYTFHHTDPHKKDINIAKARMSWKRLEIELHKCALLCERCHRIRHSNDESTCTDKRALASMERHRKNKRLAVEYKGRACLDCGFKSEVLSTLDFHHRNPAEKELKMSRLLNGSFVRIKKEVDKCDLLCCNCHIIRHTNLRTNTEGNHAC